jgi:hypothetical protein
MRVPTATPSKQASHDPARVEPAHLEEPTHREGQPATLCVAWPGVLAAAPLGGASRGQEVPADAVESLSGDGIDGAREVAAQSTERLAYASFGKAARESRGPWPPSTPGGAALCVQPSLTESIEPARETARSSVVALDGEASPRDPASETTSEPASEPAPPPVRGLGRSTLHPTHPASSASAKHASPEPSAREQVHRDKVTAACQAAELEAELEAQRRLSQQRIAAIWAELETECLQIWHEVMVHRQKVMQDLLDKWSRLLVD